MDVDSAGSNIEATFRGNDSNKVLTDIKPTFPPDLSINDLIKNIIKPNALKSVKIKSPPNSFIAYRMALQKEYLNKNIKLPPMSQLSIIAKNGWYKEPQDVKNFYNNLAKEAKSLYNQKTFIIKLDKHMNVVENDQGNGQVTPLHVTGEIFAADLGRDNNTQTKAVVDMIYAQSLSSKLLTIEDSGAMCPHFDNGSTSISQVGTYLNHNFLEDPNDQVYKKLLVQIHTNLFIHDLLTYQKQMTKILSVFSPGWEIKLPLLHVR
ncbi:1917_t:CDS:2 [Funneliformis caledonium]|uniref:1917_t:CDS:1 n=1 Tax=Funneliformis caledonium TaxID=1117310 RepID=A0A9N9H9C4_9GLOM|nr:1917_t:CDS:2 [Funneliformis caledonium]